MSWKHKVSLGFGIDDAVFAQHPNDRQRAIDAIKDAKSAGATFEDFEKEIVWHVYKKVTAAEILKEHVAKQVETARDLWG